MYRKHFGLTRHPFSKGIDTDNLFPSLALRELDARLAHLLDLRGIGLVTGDSGCGKTSACRKLVASLHSGLYKPLYVSLTTGNVMDLYKSIAWELGLHTERNRAGLFRQICAEVSRLVADARQKPILIVDEAHLLRNDVLEELRLLTNYNMDSDNRLCLLLVGHPELRRRLGMAVHEALAQRIVVRAAVPGLTRDEVPVYLQHLLRIAGTELPLFDPPAVEALFQASSGLPRKLNLLAHHALLAAALAKAKGVSPLHVQAAAAEISLGQLARATSGSLFGGAYARLRWIKSTDVEKTPRRPPSLARRCRVSSPLSPNAVPNSGNSPLPHFEILPPLPARLF